MKPSFGTALLLATLSLPVPAAAQSSTAIALDQLDPSPAGDPFFGVPSPFVDGHLVPRAHAMLGYADGPLTLAQGEIERDVVGSQALLHLGASLALWNRLLVAVALPLAVAQTGDGAAVPGEPAPPDAPAPGAPDAPAAGDLRLGLRVRALGEKNDPVQLGASFGVHLPTGATDAYMGEGSVQVAPQLLVGGRVERWLVWSAAAGATFRSSGNPSTVTYGGGAALLLWDERLQVGPEIYAATPIQGGSVGLSDRTRVEHTRTTRAETLLGARVRPLAHTALGGLVVGAAGGPGFGNGIGTPAFRLVGMLAWAPSGDEGAASAADTDGDGLLDAEEACPYAAGPRSADAKRNGCPAEDRDEDGVPDPDDACPEQAGETGAAGARRGCPLDMDADGLPDAIDFCPKEPGPADGNGTKPGCPVPTAPPPPPVTDADGDGLLDPDDACPREKGPASEDAAARGCPKRVRVQGDEVVLLEPVAWKGLQALQPAIDPRSAPAVEELAAVIQDHPEWARIEVQAHTDGTGDKRFNQMISEARAEALRKGLVEKGVAAERLAAKGYGASKPIADNAKAEGREKNRRVQLVVLEKK
ncbi:OmpA family protein [Sorangium sp. So ce1182]|uniref:OmpA family protein n=1 Tax=Sorangium sp. So ce1182 TaxID=3133334 RepID=UPI003F6019C7